MIDRSTVEAMIRSTRDEPWEQWYDCTRLAIADLLDDGGLAEDATVVRVGQLESDTFTIRLPDIVITEYTLRTTDSLPQSVSLSRVHPDGSHNIIRKEFVSPNGSVNIAFPLDQYLVGYEFRFHADDPSGGGVLGSLRYYDDDDRRRATAYGARFVLVPAD